MEGIVTTYRRLSFKRFIDLLDTPASMTVPSREEYLDECIGKVMHYKSLIEERTGIDLGEVRVRDIRSLPLYATKHYLIESLGEKHQKGNYLECLATAVFSPVSLAIFTAASLISYWNTPVVYRDSTLFFNTRKKIRLDALTDDIGIDRDAIHELSHLLWETLGGEKSKFSSDGNPRLPMMIEGFATYCERTWFADLYPVNKDIDYADLWGAPDYLAGGLRMTRFVQEYGEDILLQVPRRWKELDLETTLTEPEFLVSTRDQIAAFKGKIDYGPD